jgi:hypothetical protein
LLEFVLEVGQETSGLFNAFSRDLGFELVVEIGQEISEWGALM